MRGNWTSILNHLRQVVAHHAQGGLSDADLLDRFASRRDEAAFEVLVWRYGPMVLGLGRRMLRSPQDADDVLQATFLALVRQAARVRGDSLGAWLHKVAYRVALQVRVQRRKHVALPLEDTNGAEASDSLQENEIRLFLDEELQRLPRKYRTPLVLSYLQGLTNREIAAELRCPVGTIFTRLARGRELLRTRLTRRGVTLPASAVTAAMIAAAPATVISADLAKTTIQGAMAFAGGVTTVAPHVAALTKGVLQMMWLSRLKVAAAVLALVLVAGSGAGLLAFRAPAQEREAQPGQVERNAPLAQESKRPVREALRYNGKSFDEWRTLLLTELSPKMRIEGFKALTAFGRNGYGKEAAGAIVELMEGFADAYEEQQVRFEAYNAMTQIGDEARSVILNELKSGKARGKAFAAFCLGGMAGNMQDAIPKLEELIRERDPQVRQEAIKALGEIDGQATTFAGVVGAIKDQDTQVRLTAVRTLNRFAGKHKKEAIAALQEVAIKDKEVEVRSGAQQALRNLQIKPSEILPVFQAALKEENPVLRLDALRYLVQSSSDAAQIVPNLIVALKSAQKGEEQRLIVQTLGNIGPAAKDAIPALTELLKDREPSGLRDHIIQAIQKINK